MSINKKQAVLSLSGGMDSSTVLLHLLAHDYDVTAVAFDYGQKHKIELKRAQELVNYLNINNQTVKFQIIKLDGLVDLLNSNLVEGGEDVPEGHYEEDNMKDTVVPNRNKMFSSIIQAVALSIANEKNCNVDIAMGIHAGDHAIYPDCRQEFRDADYEAFKQGNWEADKVKYYTPFIDGDKYDILLDGQSSCKILDLDFDEVYKRTHTSYKPIKHYHRPETNAYEWYSDYKSASSVERIEAFIKLGRPDPTKYADETGPVEYEVAKKHVEQLLENYG
jgi:7-cyano-7-deazaguanine synthase